MSRQAAEAVIDVLLEAEEASGGLSNWEWDALIAFALGCGMIKSTHDFDSWFDKVKADRA